MLDPETKKSRYEASAVKRAKKVDDERRAVVEKLLKQQRQSRSAIDKPSKPVHRTIGAHCRSIENSNGKILAFTTDYPPTLLPHHQRVGEPIQPQRCARPGCNHIKLYQIASNNVPVCSLECYKKILSA